MWRDISDDVWIRDEKLLDGIIHIGVIKHGMIGVLKEGYRVRLEREYDAEGFVNRFFIEKFSEPGSVFRITHKPEHHLPILEVRNMKLLELEVKGKQIFFNVEMIESFQQKTGNLSLVKMQSGIEYEVDYNAERIKQKIGEATSKPAT